MGRAGQDGANLKPALYQQRGKYQSQKQSKKYMQLCIYIYILYNCFASTDPQNDITLVVYLSGEGRFYVSLISSLFLLLFRRLLYCLEWWYPSFHAFSNLLTRYRFGL